MAKYDENPVPPGTSRRWEVLIADEEASGAPDRARRTALDVRAEHRVLVSFSREELAAMPLLAEGKTLRRRAWYIDLHDPARADFMAEGDEIVEPGQHVIARADVRSDLWEQLRRACDSVVGRSGLRPAV